MPIISMNLHELLEIACKFLFTHEYKQIQYRITQLVKQNDRKLRDAGQEVRYGFIFDGTLYREPVPPLFHKDLPGLHGELYSSMELISKDQKLIRKDEKMVQQVLCTMLRPIETYEDLRNVLPEELIPAFTNITSDMQRTQEPGYTIRDNPRAWSQFQKVQPRIEFYSSTRLLY